MTDILSPLFGTLVSSAQVTLYIHVAILKHNAVLLVPLPIGFAGAFKGVF